MGAAKKVFLGQCRTQSASPGARSNDSSLTNVLGLRIGGATVRTLSMVRVKDHFSSRKAEFVARIQQVTSRKSKVRPASPCRERPGASKVSSLVFILLFLCLSEPVSLGPSPSLSGLMLLTFTQAHTYLPHHPGSDLHRGQMALPTSPSCFP